MKIFLASIAWRGLEGAHVQCLLDLALLAERREGLQVGFALRTGDALVERSRSVLATQFLEHTDSDVLLSLDSDIVFKAEDAITICEQALDYDIVCGLYVYRAGSPQPALALAEGRFVFGSDPTPAPVDWAATGFMATHRRVFEKLAQREDMAVCHDGKPHRFRPFYHTMPYDHPLTGHIMLSEDYAFCERAREEGFGVYVNPAVRLGHIGGYTFRLEDMLRPPLDPAEISLTREDGRILIERIEQEVG